MILIAVVEQKETSPSDNPLGNRLGRQECHCQLKCWVAQNQNDNVTGKWQGSIVGEFQLESSGECYRQRHTVVWGQPSFLYR